MIDQGTLLDRIDFNITATKENVVKAKEHLACVILFNSCESFKLFYFEGFKKIRESIRFPSD